MVAEMSCPRGRKRPFFSIVIPSCNRPEQLLVCLQGLARLDYPRESFEVIVVIDGKGKPREAPLVYLREFLNLTILEQPHSGPAMARNAGAGSARGEFLSFLDDDCVPGTDWLKRLADRFAASPDCAVGGNTINVLWQNSCSAASQMLIDYLHSHYNADPLHARFLASNNLAMSARQFHLIGGFNTRYSLAAAEDRELCRRWLHHGYGMIHEPKAIVYHAHALRFRSFWRQHFGYGFGAFLFHRVRAEERHGRFLPEPSLFYLNLMLYPLRERSRQRLLFLWLLLVSQAANTLGYFSAWVRGKNG